jgi:hypothetical protein
MGTTQIQIATDRQTFSFNLRDSEIPLNPCLVRVNPWLKTLGFPWNGPESASLEDFLGSGVRLSFFLPL